VGALRPTSWHSFDLETVLGLSPLWAGLWMLLPRVSRAAAAASAGTSRLSRLWPVSYAAGGRCAEDRGCGLAGPGGHGGGPR
jgi:hypothetical protein